MQNVDNWIKKNPGRSNECYESKYKLVIRKEEKREMYPRICSNSLSIKWWYPIHRVIIIIHLVIFISKKYREKVHFRRYFLYFSDSLTLPWQFWKVWYFLKIFLNFMYMFQMRKNKWGMWDYYWWFQKLAKLLPKMCQ